MPRGKQPLPAEDRTERRGDATATRLPPLQPKYSTTHSYNSSEDIQVHFFLLLLLLFVAAAAVILVAVVVVAVVAVSILAVAVSILAPSLL